MSIVLIVLPGVIAAYLMFLRPRLAAYPAFVQFYREADGFWGKVWAVCGRSLTLAWSYAMMSIGFLLNQLDGIAALLGDPDLKAQVADMLHADPKYLGYFTMVVSFVTIASRLRSLAKGM
ncbi:MULTISPECIES: hypothetical protein [unclassified Bradyrhizobium]|uniref:hypothetical protein n=1 Tax=unclassified Bradyrhizobium TaxID=2631580 RepID=UPI0029165FDE|nr:MULTISPECIES: hypothetical protein [unclassified Bradyrhizobium]